MKLTILVPNYLMSSETFIISQVRGLIDQGHTIRLVALSKLKNKTVYTDDEYPVFADTESVQIPNNDLKKITAIVRLMIDAGFWFSFKSLKALNVFKYGKQAAKLYLLFYALRFKQLGINTAIVSHFGHVGRIIGFFKEMKLIDCQQAVIFHGFDYNVLVKKYGPAFYKGLFKGDSIILPVSNFLKKGLLEIGSAEERTFVHRVTPMAGVFHDLSFDQRQKSDHLHLVTIARLVDIKGVNYAIDAMQILTEKAIDFHFDIIGDGPERQKLEKQVAELNLSSHVSFKGQLISEEIKDILLKTDMFILASIIDEGGPISLQEAILSGVLTIGTQMGGIPELIQEDGIIVEPHSAKAIADAVVELTQIENKDELRLRARDRIKKEFDIERLNHKLVSYFN